MTVAIEVCRKYSAGVTETPRPGTKSIPGWLSVPVIDRSRDFIDGRDMDLGEFMANPVVLWCHKIDQPPIARVPDLSAKSYQGSGFNGLFGNFEFDANDEFAMKVRDKYEAGYLRGFSVGFIPAGGWRDLNADEVTKLGLRKGARGRRMVSGKLLEASCVPVPDNQAALAVVMKTFGESIPDGVKAFIAEMTPAQTTFAADWTKVAVGSPGQKHTSPVTTKGAGMADETKPTETPVESHEVQLGDESAVLFKGITDLNERLDKRDSALESALNSALGKIDALSAEVAELKAWNTNAEEFLTKQADAIAGLYQRKGR